MNSDSTMSDVTLFANPFSGAFAIDSDDGGVYDTPDTSGSEKEDKRKTAVFDPHAQLTPSSSEFSITTLSSCFSLDPEITTAPIEWTEENLRTSNLLTL
jgi:hypothetical protein